MPFTRMNYPARGDGSGTPGKDGKDGTTFTPSVSAEGVLSWTNNGGKANPDPVNIKGPKGDTGEAGQAGAAGTDGVSPTVSVEDIIGGHKITITDKDGDHEFNVMDGEDGEGTSAIVDNEISDSSENPVQNKVIAAALEAKADEAETRVIMKAESANFFDITATSGKRGNVTYTIKPSGIVIADGTSNGSSYMGLGSVTPEAGTYILSDGLSASESTNVFAYINKMKDGTNIGQLVNTKGVSEKEFTIDYDGYDSIVVGLTVNNGITVDNLIMYPTIRKKVGGGSADSVAWNDITDKPDFATVATSGSYNDLGDKPTIPDAYDDTAVKNSIKALDVSIQSVLQNKVDKEDGKVLSTNDYTDEEKTKLADLVNIKSVGTGLNFNAATGELTCTIEGGFEVIVASDFPTTNIRTDALYLIPSEDAKTRNIYDEYLYVNNEWEKVGSASIDLTGYATETYVDDVAANKVDKITGKGLSTNDYTTDEKDKLSALPTNAALQTALDSKQDALTFDDAPTANSDNPVKSDGVKTAIQTVQDDLDDVKDGTTDYNLHITDAEVKTAFESAAGTSINPSYSTEEQFTGKYWIDGKKIYSKTIDCGAVATGNKTVAHGITGLERVITMFGSTKTTDGYFFVVPWVNPTNSSAQYGIGMSATATNIELYGGVGDGSKTTSCVVTIEYTKA